MGDPGKGSPLLSHLLPGTHLSDVQSAAQTPNMHPAGADFYSGCVSISPAPAPSQGVSPLSQSSAAYTYTSGGLYDQKPISPLQSQQSTLHDLHSGRSWDVVEGSSTGLQAYCISETSSSAPVSMHGSIHARASSGWHSDRAKKNDAKLHGKGATDMRRCATSSCNVLMQAAACVLMTRSQFYESSRIHGHCRNNVAS